MLGIIVIAGCVLMTCARPPMSGYSLGTLSGGRGQEYTSGYRTGGGFVGMKDSQGDYVDHPGTNRYTVVAGVPGHSSTSGSSYSPDSGYSDSSLVGSQAGAFQAQTNVASSDSPYSSVDTGTHGGSSSELAGTSYSPSGSGSSSSSSSSASSGGLGGYSTSGAGAGNAATGYNGYTDTSGGGHGLSSHSLGNERGEYSSSHPSTSYVTYTIGGPKASAYTSSNVGHVRDQHVHGMGTYSSSPSSGFSVGTGHRGTSSSSPSSSSYPSETSHPVISSGSGYSSGSSLNSFLASMHGNNVPSNYIQHGSGGSHRGVSPGHHIFASASNPSHGYTSRIPSSGYFSSNSPYTRGGGGGGGGVSGSPGKIIIVKESNGGGHHTGHGYPGEQHSYSGSGMFAGGNGGYKIRNVGSGTSHGPPSFTSGYSSPAGYNVVSPSHSSNNHGGSFFGFL